MCPDEPDEPPAGEPGTAGSPSDQPDDGAASHEAAGEAAEAGSPNGSSDAASASDGAAESDSPEPPLAPTRIVGIGASAGGLEPLERFFSKISRGSGIAFAVVQHLSPDFRSMMAELLQRHSELTIKKIEDGMAIEPEHIYLNPPRSSLSIENGRFRVTEAASSRELTLPINDFFASLARFAGKKAIGVVLSGTGSDGTGGAEAIAAAGGLVLAQDPISAKFQSMPLSVIEHVPGAVFARVEELAEFVVQASKGQDLRGQMAPLGAGGPPEGEILRQLQLRFGIDFGYYKIGTVGRRIMRRAKLSGYGGLEDFAATLSDHPAELEELYADLLIGVTAFFRDAEAFDQVRDVVTPALTAVMREGREARVWVPGCASGEEAYSIAILATEAAREARVPLGLKIFATDMHPKSLKIAARGLYSEGALSLVDPELRDRYFTRTNEGYQVKKEIRDSIVFSRHNIIKDPPFTRIDFLSCRNLLIYFNDDAQSKCIAMFHFALNRHGHMLLGPSETLGNYESEFETVSSRWRLFKKKRDVRLLEATRMLPSTSRIIPARLGEIDELSAPTASFRQPVQISQRHQLMRMYDAVLRQVVPTAILVSSEGEVLHIFADAGKFLRITDGQFSRRINDLVPPLAQISIGIGIDRITKGRAQDFEVSLNGELPVRLRLVRLELGGDPEDDPILITLAPRESPAQLAAPASPAAEGMFETAGLAVQGSALHDRITELERDLRASEETLQTTIEELEAANEELQSTNEELQATNEELMASNEELQTVNEELHAVNEELYTVSSEHQAKISELTSMTSDLDNLLRSVDIGVVFLDRDLNIRWLTPAVERTFNILERDVGRPITHVTARFDSIDIQKEIEDVIAQDRVIERNIEVDNRDYLLRILPYRRGDEVDGAALTFIDITDIARANRSLAQFADIVSHDLKAPLRAIRTAGDWVIEDLGPAANDEARKHVALLQEQTDRLARMLENLRDFSSSSWLQQPKEAVRLGELIDDVVRMFDDTQLLLKVEIPPGMELTTTRTALRLVLQNLIENAVRHSDKMPVTVTIDGRATRGIWRFAISDDGPGIDPRHHERIFQPFRKLKTSASDAQGSGIGLALVEKTVRERGGRIEIESNPAERRGAVFTFTWPE